MKYLSLFRGIGGLELGIQQAYEDLQKTQEKRNKGIRGHSSNSDRKPSALWRGESPTCIGYSEINKYAIQISEKHFKHKNYGDITKIVASEIPDHDLLVGGFPCQSFSIAGKRGGFKDTRGTLFFDIARILKAKRPRLLLLENVKGLLSHDEGNTFATIISTLDELGYDLQWQVLNSKNFGVPQNRERVFIIGHLRGTSRPKVFPITGKSEVSDGEQTIRFSKFCGKITTKDGFAEIGEVHRVYGEEGIAPPVKPHHTLVKSVLTPDRPNKRQNGRRFKEDGEPMFTLTGQDVHGVTIIDKKGNPKNKDHASTLSGGGHSGGNHSDMDLLKKDTRIRRLTPTECERLQGFPDGWTKYGIDKDGKQVEISDSQRYKVLGNAVTVNVIKEIVKRLL